MDTRRKKVVSVLVLGSLLLVWRLYALYEKYGPSSASAVESVPEAAVIPAKLATDASLANASDRILEDLLARQKDVEGQEWGRNPFAAIPWVERLKSPEAAAPARVDRTPAAPQIRFSGVSRSGTKWLAAIDGDIRHVGDVIQEHYKLIRITRHSLTLGFDGWTFEYHLGTESATVNRLEEEHP